MVQLIYIILIIHLKWVDNMKITNVQEMDKKDVFLCFSPPLKNFLVNIKGIFFVDETFNEKSKKNCWWFLKSDYLNKALIEWTERGKNNNKIY